MSVSPAILTCQLMRRSIIPVIVLLGGTKRYLILVSARNLTVPWQLGIAFVVPPHGLIHQVVLIHVVRHIKVRPHPIHGQAFIKDVVADMPHAAVEVLLTLSSAGPLVDGELSVVAEPADQLSREHIVQMRKVMGNPGVPFVKAKGCAAVVHSAEFAP